ncbi:sensor histidine kinase [Streptomyces sp. PCS3-D2]|uniref:sensor histidine kinase n=1 Tax=Streptomyces sp. PCS3-D2 TaxID=1460244 RepID=UPI001F38208C|nr:sensor histidine kinase [Streptomyces sp. PCS3-D2]WKV72797.1 sensor histidine kinase [Streptomyces sp. PCS3-D2]
MNEQRVPTAKPKPSGPVKDVAPRLASVMEPALELFTLRRDPLPRMGRPLPRWLARLPHVLVAYAAVFFGFLTTEQLMDHYHVKGGPPLAVALLTALSIWLAMFRPIAAWWLALLAAGWIASMIRHSVGPGQWWPWTPGGILAFALVLLLVSLRVPPRVTIWVVTVSLALTGTAELTSRPDGSQISSMEAAVLFGFVGLLGYALRALRLARGELVEQETLTAEERARRTVLEERSRIARELHDVVAHHMSVISIQAQVAPHLVDNPSEELKENLAGIRENALEALTELRRVLGVLRSEQGGDLAAPKHPQPTLAELDGLVDNVRGAGLDVTTEVAGIRRPLAPGVELTAYRIVQEALSNCLRHAPGSRVEVGVAYGPRELYLCVANSAPSRPAAPSQGAGHGMLGMRERAGMLGGELAAGPRPDGGYEVSAVLPTAPQTPPADTDTSSRTETRKAP